MTPEELIEKGIENIEKYGHHKGHFGSREEGYCAIGAIRAAAWSQDWDTFYEAGERMRAAVKTMPGFACQEGYTDPVPSFNDDPATTTEDVILMMKKAANHG